MNKQTREWQKTRRRIRWFVGGHVAAVCFIYAASLYLSDRWLAQQQAQEQPSITPVASKSADVEPAVKAFAPIAPIATTPMSPTDKMVYSNDLPAPWTEDANGLVRWVQP